MASILCPSCSQQNADDMAFCIYCGSTLKPGKPSGRQPRIATGACPSCRKTDLLNSLFCIHCGSPMSNGTSDVDIAGAHETSEKLALLVLDHAPATGKPLARRSALPWALMAVVIAAGLLAGAATAYFVQNQRSQGHSSVLPANMPQKGIVLWTNQPNVDIGLKSSDNRQYVIGRTASDSGGSFQYAGIQPDVYSLTIDHDKIADPVKVMSGQPTARRVVNGKLIEVR
jgi:hypothetical protein